MSSINKYAPVIVPTLNRYAHLTRLVNSLLSNPEAEFTELVIGLDFPPSDKYVSGWNKIKSYLPTISGFGKITVIEAEKNLGPMENLSVLKRYVFSEGYDRYIVSEDDNEFSPNFLAFMNWGLEKYKDDDRVMAVSGYNYPIDMSSYDNNFYFSHYFAAWGCGRMKDKDDFLINNIYKLSYLKKIIFNPFKLLKILHNVGPSMVVDMFSLYRHGYVYGDCYLTYYLQTEGKYCLFPKESKVRNWGHDGSGLHCGDLSDESLLYHKQPIDQSETFCNDENISIKSDPIINKKLKDFFSKSRTPLSQRFKKSLFK